ncbi:MAG: hypothetical protein D6B28_02755 [Gammaproteobacteria bacterium]|nr:MAG: hypothetical protein D6B28_02755 [Gammaproteobacteria bacterium]
MPIDWDDFDRDIDAAINDSAAETDDILAGKISSITRMTDAEIKELFPTPADVQKLKKLIQIVKSAEEQNTKINKIVDDSEQFAGIIIKLLDKFV